MKGRKFISFLLATAMTVSAFGGLGLTASAAESTAYSWSFEDGTKDLTISNNDLIKVEALDAGQSKTEAASPSGQVLHIGSKNTTGTGNAYVTLPKEAFVDETGKIKDEFQVSFDINSTDNGWRYAFYVGDGTTNNSLYFVPAGAIVGGANPVYGTRAEVYGKNATKDSRVMTLNKWVHVDIIKKGNTFVTYEDGERLGVLDNDAVASLSGEFDKMFAAMGFSPHKDPGLNAYIDNLTIYNTADEQLLNRAKTIYYCYWDTETTGKKAPSGTASSTEVNSDTAGQRFLLETDGDLSGLDSVSVSNGWDSGGNPYKNTCTINVYALMEKPADLGSADLQNPVGTFVQSKNEQWGYVTNKADITGNIPEGAKYLVVTLEDSAGGNARVYAEYISLSYKEKEPQPQITVNYMAETLDGFTTDSKYTITADGGVNDTETISEDTTLPIKDTYFGKTIKIVKKGGEETADSIAQELDIPARPDAPAAAAVPPKEAGGKGTVTGVDNTMEYSIDNGETWKECTDDTIVDEGLIPGVVVLVRKKATESSFKGKSFSSVIGQYDSKPEDTPDIKIDYINEKLTGFVEGDEYTINDNAVVSESGELEAADYIGKKIKIIKKGKDSTTLDSEAQILNIPNRPAAPEEDAFTVTHPTEKNGDGIITGITTAMEYSTDNGENWTQGIGENVNVKPGRVFVRVKAKNDPEGTFRSESIVLKIENFAEVADKDHRQGNLDADSYTAVFDASKITGAVSDYNIKNDEKGILPGWSDNWGGKNVQDGKEMNSNFTTTADNGIHWFQFYGAKPTADGIPGDIYTPGYGDKDSDWFAIEFIMSTSTTRHDAVLLDNNKKPFFGYSYKSAEFLPGGGEESFDEEGNILADTEWAKFIQKTGEDKCNFTNGTSVMRIIVDNNVTFDNDEDVYAVTCAVSTDGGADFTVVGTRYYKGSADGFGGIRTVTVEQNQWYHNSRYGNMKVYVGKTPAPKIAIDYENEMLTGFEADAEYTIDGADVTLTDDSELAVNEDWFGKTISIAKKGGENKPDSFAQELDIPARPDAPTKEQVKDVQPDSIGGKGKITGITDAMEYSKDNGATWTVGNGTDLTDIEPGTKVLVRMKAAEIAFKSANIELAIAAYGAKPEETPEIAINYEHEMLTGFEVNAEYTIDGENVTEGISEDGTLDVTEYIGKTIKIVKKGDNVTTADSEEQELSVPARPTAPAADNFAITGPTEADGNGTVEGITDAMEYSMDNGENWEDGVSDEIVEIPAGDVLVRIKATAASFKSAATKLTVPAYVPESEDHFNGKIAADTYDTVFDASEIDILVKDYDIKADEEGIFKGWSSNWTAPGGSEVMNVNFIRGDGTNNIEDTKGVGYIHFYGPRVMKDGTPADVYTPIYGSEEGWFAIEFIMSASDNLGCHDAVLLDKNKKPFFGYAYAKSADGFFPGDGERDFDEDGNVLNASKQDQWSKFIAQEGDEKCTFTNGSTIMRIIVDNNVKYEGEDAYAVTSAYSNDNGETFTVINTRYYKGSVDGFGGIRAATCTNTNTSTLYANTRYGNIKIYVEKGIKPAEPPETDPTNPPETNPTNPPETDPTEPPKTDPTNPPETDPTNPPETDPTNPPETDPTNPPETDPTNPPETDPTNPPETDPTNPPETDPTNPPETDPTNPPETDPTNPPETDPTNPPLPDAFGIKYDNGNAIVTAPKAGKYTVIFAVYKDGEAVSVEFKEVSFTKAETQTVNPSKSATGKVKVMLWDTIKNMKPLCRADESK